LEEFWSRNASKIARRRACLFTSSGKARTAWVASPSGADRPVSPLFQPLPVASTTPPARSTRIDAVSAREDVRGAEGADSCLRARVWSRQKVYSASDSTRPFLTIRARCPRNTRYRKKVVEGEATLCAPPHRLCLVLRVPSLLSPSTKEVIARAVNASLPRRVDQLAVPQSVLDPCAASSIARPLVHSRQSAS
jgi:hypothetical protein